MFVIGAALEATKAACVPHRFYMASRSNVDSTCPLPSLSLLLSHLPA